MRIAIVVLAALMLAACGTSKVTRTSGPAASTPQPGETVTVKRGDTLYRIAVGNGISPLDLATWNNISSPYTIYPGQRLRLYPGGSSAGTSTPPRSGTPSRPQPQQPAAPPQAPVRSSVTWRWPAEGQIISRFAEGDPTKQGIGIAGNGGQAVNAAADGVVVYSGSGLVGYGELIIVKHDDNWLSAYGHNRSRLVNEGERVRVGQQIAEMGSSGTARDMLHFEIRYNGRPVDPLSYLPRR